MAAAFGVNPRRIGMLAAASPRRWLGWRGADRRQPGRLPAARFAWVGLIFAVVILGGIGNLLGAVGAGILIGLVAGLVGVAWTPQGAPLVVFLLLILALLFRPNGLFGRLGAS